MTSTRIQQDLSPEVIVYEYIIFIVYEADMEGGLLW